MPVRIEDSGYRSVTVEVVVAGTQDEVWDAIATGPGLSAWLAPTEMDGRKGGFITCHMGGGRKNEATLTSWEAPLRFTAVSQDFPDSLPLTTDWSVEPRPGGTCVVRVVHSLYTSVDCWDHLLESFETAWPTILEGLKQHLSRSGSA